MPTDAGKVEIAAHMPLAGHRSEVSGLMENLRDGHARVVKEPTIDRVIGPLVASHIPNPCLMGIEIGQQR